MAYRDLNAIINDVHDEASDALRVVVVSGGGGSTVDGALFTADETSAVPIAGIYGTAIPDVEDDEDGTIGAVAMTASRALKVALDTAGGDERFATGFPGSIHGATGNGAASNDRAVPIGGNTLAAGAGTRQMVVVDAAGSMSVTQAALTVANDAVTAHGSVADDAAFTPATTKVQPAGFFADEASTDSVDEGDAGAARMTLDRKQIVTLQPHTTGGALPFYNLDVDESEDAIKASAGQVYELYLNNTTNAQLYVKLYNATTANVTVGTTTPAITIPVPGNNDTDGAGVVRQWVNGLKFDTAITIAATTAAADNDTGAPGAGAIIASGAYL